MKRIPALFALLVLALPGCGRPLFHPEWAADPYPRHLHATGTVDIQVFRTGTDIELVNSTAHSFEDFFLWINQRYVRRVDSLPAGASRRLSLWEFYDERGETLNAGGFWRIYEPDPVRLVQIQVDEQSPLIGLIAVREQRQDRRLDR